MEWILLANEETQHLDTRFKTQVFYEMERESRSISSLPNMNESYMFEYTPMVHGKRTFRPAS